LVREAGINAMRKDINAGEITKEDFAEAMKEMRPSVTEEMNEFYKSIMKKRQSQQIEEDLIYIK